MTTNKLQKLAEQGQSIWLDFISQQLLRSGELQTWIDQGLRGLTSNPSIFHQAISSGSEYDKQIVSLKETGKSAFEIYDALSISDIQEAADLFAGIYEQSGGLDGYVSLEIDPRLAHDAKDSILEGQRLFEKVGRPNTMIKVPATDAGFPVVEELIASGVNVNVTLIFSPQQYRQSACAYIRGMQHRQRLGEDVSVPRSVASVFVSRIDNVVDKLLEEKIPVQASLSMLRGKAAVANCRAVMTAFQTFYAQAEYETLKANGCPVQRVLWGSTSTKNPAYSDVKYVEELIVPDTVNTVPAKTLEAFKDHGVITRDIALSSEQAEEVLQNLAAAGIDMPAVYAQLLDQGLQAFVSAFDELLQAIDKKAERLCGQL